MYPAAITEKNGVFELLVFRTTNACMTMLHELKVLFLAGQNALKSTDFNVTFIPRKLSWEMLRLYFGQELQRLSRDLLLILHSEIPGFASKCIPINYVALQRQLVTGVYRPANVINTDNESAPVELFDCPRGVSADVENCLTTREIPSAVFTSQVARQVRTQQWFSTVVWQRHLQIQAPIAYYM